MKARPRAGGDDNHNETWDVPMDFFAERNGAVLGPGVTTTDVGDGLDAMALGDSSGSPSDDTIRAGRGGGGGGRWRGRRANTTRTRQD